MNRRIWTDEETEYLRENCTCLSLTDMGMHLHVAASTVRNRLRSMGIETDGNRRRAARVWSDDDLAYLRENFSTMPAKDIADRMGCSDTTVSNKARELGLRKSPGWSRNGYRGRYVNRYSGRRAAL